MADNQSQLRQVMDLSWASNGRLFYFGFTCPILGGRHQIFLLKSFYVLPDQFWVVGQFENNGR